MAPYRVLVVDDSGFMRKIISDLIIQDSQFTIVATASNGQEAIEAVHKWKPDAVTLDLEMPLMNGIEALQIIMREYPTPVIMLSGISEDNTRETIKALQFGAFDFIRKPSSAISNDIHQVGELLIEKLRIGVQTKSYQPIISIHEKEKSRPVDDKSSFEVTAAAKRKQLLQDEPLKTKQSMLNKDRSKSASPKADRKVSEQAAPTLPKRATLQKTIDSSPKLSEDRDNVRKTVTKKSLILPKTIEGETPGLRNMMANAPAVAFKHLVAIGTSTGGPRALHAVITSLPADFPAPVLIVQHMPPKFTKSLAQRLDSFSELQVVEAEQGMRVSAGVVYIAPGGHHMELAKDSNGYSILLTVQPQRNGHRPSVDVLFESLTAYRELKRHAVVMTGMGSDGAKGMKLLVESGIETAIAEAEETCVVYGMPRSAVETGCVNKVLPLQQIASGLVQAVMK